jgi:flagella basal body P-ring formation protein FlgA
VAIAAERNKAEALQAQIEAEGRVRASAMTLAADEQLSAQEFKARMLEVLATDKRARESEQTKRDLFAAEVLLKRTSPDRKGI